MINKKYFFLAALFALNYAASAQTDSLMKAMEKEQGGAREVSGAAFKSGRLILSETTAMVKKYDLDFKVVHRFGDIAGTDGGGKTLVGLDNSSDIYINFEYGISDRLNIGFGRSKYEQLLDLQLKYALMRQSTDGRVPFSIGLVAKTGFTPYEVTTDIYDDYINRFSYLGQVIIARKFSPDFSLQVSPTLLLRNRVLAPGDEASLFALGAAMRYKFTKRFGIVADYYHPFSNYRDNHPTTSFYDPLGVGIEIETGGHVFTMNFVNAKSVVENNFIPNSTSSWGKGQYRFGFTISRMFTLHQSKTNNK
ncbi:DUF5777 family beta-barrel protein [Hufsiella ginkgonis]|uniref:DUF5777 domain-containing protein n=1 Tax=Hufsiella ginkgonis TaxID=2695274 RepID=A0A7K1XYL3_9SPHI|nr:DUF5777 family beta-barrel protein [Hufsiella ginkgonis]MXV16094.1 hypothetical protein [Hufsiella ginkgonis]